MGSPPSVAGRSSPSNASSMSCKLPCLMPPASKSFAVTFTTRDLCAMALLPLGLHQEAEKQKPPTHHGGFRFAETRFRNSAFRASSGLPLKAPWRLLARLPDSASSESLLMLHKR